MNHTAGTAGVHSGADVGRFSRVGLPGRGTAQVLQTLAAKTVAGVEAAYNVVLDGGGAITVSSSVVTLTDTGNFVVAKAEVGDFVYILGGGDAATGNAASIAGVHKITSRTSDNAVVIGLEIAAGHANVAGDKVSYFCTTGNPRVLAYLMDGEESGLQEWINPIDNVAAQSQVGGYSHIGGGGLTVGADSTSALADVTGQNGLKKAYEAHGAIGSNFWIEVVNGIDAKKVDFINAEFNAADEYIFLQWYGGANTITDGRWVEQMSSGVSLTT